MLCVAATAAPASAAPPEARARPAVVRVVGYAPGPRGADGYRRRPHRLLAAGPRGGGGGPHAARRRLLDRAADQHQFPDPGLDRGHAAGCRLLNDGDVGGDLDGVTLIGDDQPDPDVVILGGAGPRFSYQALNTAFGHLRRGAALVVMNIN